MSRDIGRVTVLFGREYEWKRTADGRLTLEPLWWPFYSPLRARLGLRQRDPWCHGVPRW